MNDKYKFDSVSFGMRLAKIRENVVGRVNGIVAEITGFVNKDAKFFQWSYL